MGIETTTEQKWVRKQEPVTTYRLECDRCTRVLHEFEDESAMQEWIEIIAGN